MVVSGSVRNALTVALFTAGLTAACASGKAAGSAGPAPASDAAKEAAKSGDAAALVSDADAAALAQAAKQAATPEPEVVPCKNCGVDVLGRVTGGFVDAKCGGGAAVAYPVSQVILEVLDGAQANSRFAVTTPAAKLDVNTQLEGQAAADAKPTGWLKAQLLVTDANGKSCASPISLYK